MRAAKKNQTLANMPNKAAKYNITRPAKDTRNPSGFVTPRWIVSNANINEEQVKLLRGKKLMLGLPMYGGMCTGAFAIALANFQTLCDRIGIELSVQTLMNESLIQRGRNALTHMFLISNCEYFMFIDVDIGFNPLNLIELLLATIMNNELLTGATYSKKEINWGAVRHAIANDVDDKFLVHCSGSHVVIPEDTGETTRNLEYWQLIPVQYLGTGFMLMHRSLLENMAKGVKEYKNNHIPNVPHGAPVKAIFDCEIRDGIYLSEDYLFCARAKDLGVSPKMALWVQLTHFGSLHFDGCFMCTQGGYVHDIKRKPPATELPAQIPTSSNATNLEDPPTEVK